ncbi:lipolytic enzyme, G-D-S-L [Rhodovulum sp. PH10]|uniref:SGNH/GDSL hydrolase family protein n=1 Tax=Rhodovulum sp. PH10 TaxID=1187851 RepID=UPI00027C2977|nr:SGNH/GDSL hydrolase family protein [Rhodovulum sp. PH10]EJW10655.1 lipolytic enzyme, G-D-S-L [Rhodovulum sp. PH10]
MSFRLRLRGAVRFAFPLSILALAAVLPPIGSGPAAAAEPACRAQPALTRLSDRLPRVAARLARHEPVTIVALGSSSTAGAGASSPAAAYPQRFAARLAETLPGETVRVVNQGVNGETVVDMLARFDASVAAEKPDLVLWQTGTNALLRGNSLASVRALVAGGIARMRALGADVILIDPQYAPAVLEKPAAHAMIALLAKMAKEGHADLFPRFAVMQGWHEQDGLPFSAFTVPDGLHMNDWGYGCFGRLLADAVTEAATRRATLAAAPEATDLRVP